MLENIIWKKVVCTIKFYLQYLCVAGYLKLSNDTPNLNIHKYTNYNIIEIYINRLSTITQISIAMDYLVMMSEKYLYFRKRKKTFGKDIFYPTHRISWIHILWKYFPNYVFTKDMFKNLYVCVRVCVCVCVCVRVYLKEKPKSFINKTRLIKIKIKILWINRNCCKQFLIYQDWLMSYIGFLVFFVLNCLWLLACCLFKLLLIYLSFLSNSFLL